MTRQNLGRLGEQLASRHLKNNGYRLLAKNFHSRFGEIDLIALDGPTLVFVEVKTRWSQKFGSPEEAVTPRKIRRMIKAAYYFQLLHPELPESLRLDVVAIDLSPNGKVERIEIIKNITM